MPCITLLTDFGTQDAYVAQMKGQIVSICPAVELIDVTHAVPPQDVAAGAFLLAQAVPYFPASTLHLAIVDPGVGTERRMIAAEVITRLVADEPGHLQRIVLPDNGLISLLIEQHELVGANYLTNQAFWRAGVSHTFHGRDIMGPVVAHWANGAQRADFGPACSAPARLMNSGPEFAGKSVDGQAIFVDRFGNVITNIRREQLNTWPTEGAMVNVEIDNGPALLLPMVDTYGQRQVGDLVLLIGSHGYLELARVGGNAAEHVGVANQMKLRFTVG